ncbi:MAG: aldose 1-epimerase family protein [Bacteroidales bacterium]|nr:aldose 1-epimerase family protein [Bacteroidales bacterium]
MNNLIDYIGHPYQMYGAIPYEYSQGKAKGVKAIVVRNGSGLEMNILEDRCLDIAHLTYKGINLSYLSKCGIVGPEYYDKAGYEFLQSFFVGFLTTCGLRHIGAPCTVNGESFGLHGSISGIPAEETTACVDETDGKKVIRVAGIMREARIFRENLVLKRSYEIPVGQNYFIIRNQIRNIGFVAEPVMFMLHMNFGYPLLSPDAMLVIPSEEIEPRDEDASAGMASFKSIDEPVTQYREQVYFHRLKSKNSGQTSVGLVNKKLKMGVALSYSTIDFPYTTQWKQLAKGDYVLGIEPASCKMLGREKAQKEGALDYLMPQKATDLDVRVDILDGNQAIDQFINDVSHL